MQSVCNLSAMAVPVGVCVQRHALTWGLRWLSASLVGENVVPFKSHHTAVVAPLGEKVLCFIMFLLGRPTRKPPRQEID